MMKRITILIFLYLLLSSNLVTTMAYSIDGLLDKGTPNEVLFARASGCSSCGDEGDPNG
jgi:hypothetical protein